MATDNPYRTPESRVVTDIEFSPEKFHSLATGQKIIGAAVLLYLLGTVVLLGIDRQVGILVLLLAYVVGLAGFLKTIKGIELKAYSKIIYALSMLVPVLNVLVLAHLGELAVRELKAAGYKIGLLGVKGKHTA